MRRPTGACPGHGRTHLRRHRLQCSEKLDPDAAAQDRAPSTASTSGAAGLALLGAVTLDGVPENVALGVSLGGGTGGLALLAAIFVSNFPEALVGSASMREQGRSQRFILGTWFACAAVLTLAVVVGAGPCPPRARSSPSAPPRVSCSPSSSRPSSLGP
ncbi:hypothetical protein [Actinoplanes auranticolor]|uniref:Uncharacterized protein n=1 Tax=Actinoplanes auranticolor TaxID=47988 RepID=A0A919VH05_9ACTN|nr:hypothetical protein [Actinoplanes auranticolor]GIM64832.1 hypothetical protein Aau02nite_12940 [Actinoplanes auranticolor]